MSTTLKPTHKVIKDYYDTRSRLGELQVKNEMSLRVAFQNLLSTTAKARKWQFVPEEALPGKRIRPDGTIRDDFHRRGYWEAKDTHDDLEKEIQSKIRKGYPTDNIIFEDTRTAVLYQDKNRAMEVDLDDPKALVELLNRFYAYTAPDIEEFNQAVDEFKEHVPELAKGLLKKITDGYDKNKKFKEAFDSFLNLCRTSLNPNISRAAVEEMLVQHLLTERLIRRIFENPDFTKRNVIAAEVEKVIDALTGEFFDRREFLKSLDRFYMAIENAGRLQGDFAEKQHFLNTIYERFFQGYSVKVADTHGIVYTPQPIVDFMCASVAHVLEKEFGKRLGSPGVNIIDPCTGTGNFVVNLLNRISGRDLERVYREQLFANEVMLMPYYIAALNIEHAYYEKTGKYEPFEGLCFVDTLELAEAKQSQLGFMAEKNLERVERQRRTPITVVIGNPPYNASQVNENDNNKNRKYEVIDKRIKETYAKDSKATLKTQLYDPYVKFIRWATDRLEGRDGIVCFVTNNSFVDQIAFDGMRKHLLQDFTEFYHVDLHGNVRQNPKLSGTTHNVFGIQVGVGITVAVKKAAKEKSRLSYYRVPEFWRKEEKFEWLEKAGKVSDTKWQLPKPDKHNTWLVPTYAKEFEEFLPMGIKSSKAVKPLSADYVFKSHCGGIKSNRDSVVYDFNRFELEKRMEKFVNDYNAEIDRYKRMNSPDGVDAFVDYSKIKWDGTLKTHLRRYEYANFNAEFIRMSLYRPYARKQLYFDRLLLNSVYLNHYFFPVELAESENRVICLTAVGCAKPFHCILVNVIPDLHLTGDTQCFPFYIYDKDGTNRRENITDWALEQFKKKYESDVVNKGLQPLDETAASERHKGLHKELKPLVRPIEKWDIFYYVYGLLHHPGYRERYGDNLKRELPRLPFAPDFRAFADAGRKLADLHLKYEEREPYELTFVENEKEPLSYRVEKMRLSKDKTQLVVNPSLTLAGIPAEAFDYRLGNRSTLDWVIDQYRVKEDKRSGIVSDPNRDDDPEYIVRLVGQVIAVSLETVQIVKALPEKFSDEI